MEDIRIIIMTESSRAAGSCVEGINADTGAWVRLVSVDARMQGIVANDDLISADGRACAALDIVRVPIIRACGTRVQPENMLADISKSVEIEGKATLFDVLQIHPAETRDKILGNRYSYIAGDKAVEVGYSLTLVYVENLEIHQTQASDRNLRTKVNFLYRGDHYKLMTVTDPNFYETPDGTKYNDAFLVVSTSAPHDDSRCYKSVAGIFV